MREFSSSCFFFSVVSDTVSCALTLIKMELCHLLMSTTTGWAEERKMESPKRKCKEFGEPRNEIKLFEMIFYAAHVVCRLSLFAIVFSSLIFFFFPSPAPDKREPRKMPRKSLKFSENIKIKFYEQPTELAEEKVETQTHQQQ